MQFLYASEIPAGSEIYVKNNPHESWRDFLPYYIAQYKGSSFDISRDQMQYWPKLILALCVEDAVFFSALLMSDATVTVHIGTNPAVSYTGSQGTNHWSQPFNGQTEVPVFSVISNGATMGSSSNSAPITSSTTLSNGCTNYNAGVGSF